MMQDRFLLANFIGRQNQPTLSIVRHPLKRLIVLGVSDTDQDFASINCRSAACCRGPTERTAATAEPHHHCPGTAIMLPASAAAEAAGVEDLSM